MSRRLLNLGDGASWNEVFATHVVAERLTGGTSRYFPIPEITIPILLTSHVIVVFCESEKAPSYYRFGGQCRQSFLVGIAGGNVPNAQAQQEEAIWLNKFNLILFEPIEREYALSVKVPYWLEDFRVIIYEYTGVDTFENIERLGVLEEKVDSLIEQESPTDLSAEITWDSNWIASRTSLEKASNFAELKATVTSSNPTPNQIIGQLPPDTYPVKEEVYQSLDGDKIATFSIDTIGRIRYLNGSLPMPIDKIYRIN